MTRLFTNPALTGALTVSASMRWQDFSMVSCGMLPSMPSCHCGVGIFAPGLTILVVVSALLADSPFSHMNAGAAAISCRPHTALSLSDRSGGSMAGSPYKALNAFFANRSLAFRFAIIRIHIGGSESRLLTTSV